jgi:phenylalanyl-tRNA synthetase alpha chain
MSIADQLHPLERKVFPLLKETKSFEKLIELSGLKDIEVMRALQWLQNKGLINVNEQTKEIICLDSNGLKYLKHGLPEKRFLDAIKDQECTDPHSLQCIESDEVGICLGVLRSKAAIDLSKQGKDLKIKITDHGRKLLDKGLLEEAFLQKHQFPIEPSKLKDEDMLALDNLLKRKNILKKETQKILTVELTDEGKKLMHEKLDEHLIERLSPQIMKSGLWKGKRFRKYDVKINVPEISGGRRHPVNQGINYIKRIWLDLGFKEMRGNLVQTSFWDLDSLFVPQDHPARDMQDTFYIKNPRQGKLPKEFLDRIRQTHENGWTTGSTGWKYKWSEEIAKENLLRTHTTVLSAQTISRLKKEDLPAKFFSVNKVFRNEALNWKHLFEFYQVEGIVVDRDANFANLKGYLKQFFNKMGFPDVRIRPGHFPYTEPSAEVDVWHPVRKEWVELGGSGIFRPEVTKPLLGEEIPVLAWGIGLERTLMEYYSLTDVRDLYRNDLKQLREIKMWMR